MRILAVALVIGAGAANASASVLHDLSHKPQWRSRSQGWIARDANPQHAWLYVNGEEVNVVYIYDLDKIGFPEIGKIMAGVIAPFGMAVDAQGTLYVVNQHGSGSAPGTVAVYPPGSTTPSLTIAQGLNNPQGVAVDATGTVYVTNRGSLPGIAVYASGQTTLSQYITSSLISRPIQDFFDSSGDLYFSDPDTGVSIVPQGSQQPVNLGLQGLTHAGGVALDPVNGSLYVNDWLGRTGHYKTHVYPSNGQAPMQELEHNIAGYYLTTGLIRHVECVFVPAFFSNLVYVFKTGSRKPWFTLTAASQAGSVAYKPAGVP